MIGADRVDIEGDQVSLLITRCLDCASSWFPAREQCSRCGGTRVDGDRISGQGTVYASTTVHIGAGAFPTPYALSYVDVEDIRLLAHTRSVRPLAPGTPVVLVLGEVGADGTGALWSYVAVPRTDGEVA
ncbi:Zn-ribbon domain-containing OB-fold protein [Prauserella shujinwangii]|uniref:Zn-ribbon domain-containing OB-fold protein n=1 Tax=Prauserella shujinwangii TaxID=1453103 RepID=UPI0015E5F363|nr:OB-fold domain-containing protein [Prauserella shujinwangii]